MQKRYSMKAKKSLKVFFIVFLIMGLNLASASSTKKGGSPPDAGIQGVIHDETGAVTFISGESGILINVPSAQVQGLSAPGRAMAIVNAYGSEFGLTNPGQELKEKGQSSSAPGRSVARYQQMYNGILVMGGELVVNFTDFGQMLSMNGEISPGLSISTRPSISLNDAKGIAEGIVARAYGMAGNDLKVGRPELWIYDEQLIQPSTRPAELVWRMEVTATNGAPINELVLINAEKGGITLHFNQIDTAWISHNNESLQLNGGPTPTATPLFVPTPTASPEESIQGENNPTVTVDTVYVAITGSDSNDCATTSTPCLTINGGLAMANPSGTVYVAGGTYTGSGSTGVVIITKIITLSGGWDASFSTQSGESIIDGQNSRRGIDIQSGTSTINNFTIKNGYDTGSGGGINVGNGYSLVLNDSLVTSNTAVTGSGGGIKNAGYGDTYVNNSVISNNSAGWTGGGISNDGTLFVDGSAILNNQVTTSHTGGGINSGGTVTVTNSTISGNSAFTKGGGIGFGGSFTLNNVTMTNNTAPNGGGIDHTGSTLSITNLIIAGNTGTSSAPDCTGNSFTSGGYNIFGDTTSGCNITTATGDQTNLDPQLNALTVDNVHTFGSSSPAIDLGNPAAPTGSGGTCETDDQLGNDKTCRW